MKKRGYRRDEIFFIFIIVVILFLVYANIKEYRILEKIPKIKVYEVNKIDLSELSLRQKIAQMMIVYSKPKNRGWINENNIGGVYIYAEPSYEDFKSKIDFFQSNSTIKLFIAVDLEGCNTPFDSFKDFKFASEVKTSAEAYEMGKEHGQFLGKLGFNLNFAPVVDLNDTIWKCRAFEGSPELIAEKAQYYLKGLREEGIISTVKHYPGRTLEALDPHKEVLHTELREEDIIPFLELYEDTDAIMVSHQITTGILDTEGRPAVVSEIVDDLSDKFDGVIITDEIGMMGLKKFYETDKERYIDLLRVNNDVILIFHGDTFVLERFIDAIEESVRKGEISEERIDRSVKKILEFKGYSVMS